jgi:hypothetical protein
MSPLRVNHYVTKSEEEYRAKLDQWEAAGRSLDPGPGWLEALGDEFDDAITSYVPALRAAVVRAEAPA